MDLHDQVAAAIRDELARQSEADAERLSVSQDKDVLQISGSVDLTALAAAVVGAVAGGP